VGASAPAHEEYVESGDPEIALKIDVFPMIHDINPDFLFS